MFVTKRATNTSRNVNRAWISRLDQKLKVCLRSGWSRWCPLRILLLLPTSLYLAMYAISWTKRRKKIIMGSSLQPVSENGSNNNILSGHHLDQPLRRQTFNFWSNREIHALFTFLLVFVALLVTNIPVYSLTIMRRGFAVQYQNIPIWVHFIIIDLFYLSNVLDPLLIMRNRDFRKAIVQMFQKMISSLRSTGMRRSSLVSTHKTQEIKQ